MQSKTFRFFISSTFKDFAKEREVLQTKVFPRIKQYCAQRGYAFQPIDLRWGVSEEAQLDQKTLELCLNEVRACKTHLHPNFLIMIGDRYGWIPLPYAIEKEEFETLLALASTEQEKELLVEWYKLDLNQLPASYILKERSDKYKEPNIWSEVEKSLLIILQTAVKASSLNEEQKRKYFLSATEAEVEEGIIPYIKPTKFQKEEILAKDATLEKVDPQYIFGFFRDIDKTTQIENEFIEDDYEEAQEFKKRVANVLDAKNRLHVQTIQREKESLEEEYLREFEVKITESLETQIEAQKANELERQLTSLELELRAQNYFAQNKRKNFLAQEGLRKIVADYIVGAHQQPLVIYGASGRGKSSLMAKAIQEAQDANEKKVLYRFIGATPHSSSSKEILTSLFEELGVDVRSENEKVKKDSNELSFNSYEEQETFEVFSHRVYSEFMNLADEIVIFIDAVDQLGNDDNFLWLPSNLPSNLKIVISALDDARYQEDSRYFEALKTKTQNTYEIPEFQEPQQLLKALLAKEARTLQADQEAYVLEQFKTAHSPLYISVAVQELKHWKSYDANQTLEATQHGIIKEFIENLHTVYHHDQEFVYKVLGYIYASRDGLSESELLQLLETDKEFVRKMAPDKFHKNETGAFPLVHWSRLQTQLKPFLSMKTQDNEELMYFFHREFEDVIAKLSNQKDEHEAIIKATQKLIEQIQDKPFDANRWGKLYATLIIEYELRYQEKQKQKEFAIFIANSSKIKKIQEKWIKNYLNYMFSVADKRSIKFYRRILYYKSSLRTVFELCKIDHIVWIKKYITVLNNLSMQYYDVREYNKAIKLGNAALKIIQKKSFSNFFSELNRLGILSNVAMYYKKNKLAIAIDLQIDINNTLDDKKNLNIKYAELFFKNANNLALSFKMNNQLEEAIVIQEDLLNNLEQIDFSSLNDQWKILYFTTINNLILSYKNNNFSEKAMKICKKVLNKIESCYEINHSNWVKLYLVTLNSIAHIYYDNDQIDIALGLLEKNFEISKKEYEKDTVFKHMFIECSFNIMSMYYEVDRMEEAVKKYVILKNIFESEKMIDNELFIRANKLMNQNTFIKHNVNLEILLFIATAIALRKKKNVVDVEDFFYSLSFVQFNKTIKILFYKIFGIENMQNLKLEQGSVAVHLMNNALNNQTLKYSKQLVDLKCYLEKKIGNEIIGVFYEKKI
jgi:hypothetical protein